MAANGMDYDPADYGDEVEPYCPHGVLVEDPNTGEVRAATAEEAREWADAIVERGTLEADSYLVRLARGEISNDEKTEG